MGNHKEVSYPLATAPKQAPVPGGITAGEAHLTGGGADQSW